MRVRLEARRAHPPGERGERRWPADLGPAKPQGLDEQHPVVDRQPGHQVLLIGPESALPIGESDADDVASTEARRLWLGHPCRAS